MASINPDTIKEKTTVIVRAAGERTTEACVYLLERMFGVGQVIAINEVPFSRAVRKGFEYGIEAAREWTLILDADVLVRQASIYELLAYADTLPREAFVIQGLVLDKVFGVRRPAGNHLYRTCHLRQSLGCIPMDETTLRPESATIDAMAGQGYLFYQKPFVVGLHDYEQHPFDLFKKSFVHARKHHYLIKEVLPYWAAAAQNDPDFITIILGARAGNVFEGDVHIDRQYLDRVCREFLGDNECPAKPPLKPVDYDESRIDAIISDALRADQCMTLQEKVFPKSRRDRIFGHAPEPVKTTVAGSPRLSFVAWDPDQLNGPNIWIQRVLPEFVKRGFRVQAIFVVPVIRPSKAAEGLQRQGVECLFLEKKPTTEEIITDLLAVLQQNPPDVFVPNTCVPAYYAAKWVQAAGIPTVGIVRSDDTFHHEIVEYFVGGQPGYRLSGVVCKSRFLEKYVQAHNPDGRPTLCSASGTWLPVPVAAAPSETLEIAYTGRLVQRQKRIYDVIHALERVVAEVPGCLARIYGDDREGGNVLKMIKARNLGNKLAYGGVIPLKDILPTLLTHHVFILLSDYEGMSTSLMEAMACGLVPVCTPTRSGAAEIIQHNENGLIVDNRGAAVVDAMRRLKEEPGLWQRLSRAARDTVKKQYTVAGGAERWTRFLTKLIQAAGPGRAIKPPPLTEVDLPPRRISDNGISREDVRLSEVTRGSGFDHTTRASSAEPLAIAPVKKPWPGYQDPGPGNHISGGPCLAIFTPCLGATSETFITNHVKHLAPRRTVVVTGEIVDKSWCRTPVLQIPFTNDPSRFKPETEQAVLDFLKDHQVTHILCEYGCTGTEMVILNDQVAQLPIYVHFHGYDVSQELRKKKTVSYYQWMGDHVSAIITDTSLQKQRLVDIGVKGSNIHIIPYGVPVPETSATPDTTPCRFICVGRLVPKKAPLVLLDAFARAHQDHPEMTLDLVGAGPLMEEVRAFVHAENLQTAVTLHGAIENSKVKRLMDRSCVYVQHSVTDPVSGDAEGLPVAILEAAAAGLPVVATRHEGIPDEVEHGVTGYLVAEFDADAMAAHMAQLAQDQELRIAMGAAARQKIQSGFTLTREIHSLRALMGLKDTLKSEDEIINGGLVNTRSCQAR